MVLYELTHLFFRYGDELVASPKSLGLFYTLKSVKQAIQYYTTQPGFCENQDAFSVRERNVIGDIINDIVYEVIVYLHSEDYEFETEIELGLYGSENVAQNKLIKYCAENSLLISVREIISEKIVNKRTIERLEWPKGFSIYGL